MIFVIVEVFRLSLTFLTMEIQAEVRKLIEEDACEALKNLLQSELVKFVDLSPVTDPLQHGLQEEKTEQLFFLR